MITAIYTFSIFVLIGTFLPKDDSPYWIIRGQTYFRNIYFFLNLGLVIIILLLTAFSALSAVIIAAQIYAIIYTGRSMLPYSSFAGTSIASYDGDPDDHLHLLTFNVYQDNEEYDKLRNVISQEDPDIILLLETNDKWDKATVSVQKKYHVVKEITNDTYGMIMMSKKKPLQIQLHHFVDDKVPSAEIVIEYKGRKVRVLGLHPEPPVKGEQKSAIPKEREIAAAAHYFNSQTHHAINILVGDLNDVAWTRSSKAFRQSTAMEDPREGRGLFATFPTYFPLRIPLDHVYCSPDFHLVDLRRLKDIGSDHFPIAIRLNLPTEEAINATNEGADQHKNKAETTKALS